MNWEGLTKTFMIITNEKNPLVFMAYHKTMAYIKIFQCCKGEVTILLCG